MSGAIAKTVRYSLIVVGLLIVALLAAPFFIDVNVYKSKIEQTVEDATGRKLSIGNMNATLFPSIGVELDNVHLANRAGYAKRDFLSVKRLRVKLALMPLLSKNIEIQHFEVVAPVIYLERRSNGESNWGDLVAAPAQGSDDAASASGQSAPAAPALAALQAESLSLIGGEVTWVDGDAKPVVLSELDVALTDVQLKRPVAIKVSGKLSGNAFELDANVGPLGDLAKLDPVSLPVQGQLKADNISLQPFKNLISGWPEQLGDIAKASVGISAQVEQRPDGIRLAEGEIQLRAAHKLGIDWKVEMSKADQLKISRAALTVDGKNLMEARGSVQQLSTIPTFKLRVDSQPIERTWLATFVPDLNRMYADHPAAWKQVKFSASLSGSSKKMNIGDLQLMLDDDVLKATGAVVFNGPNIRLRMSAKALHMDPWLPQGKPEQQASRSGFSFVRETIAAADISAEPDLRFLKSWLVTSTLKVDTLYLHGLEMGKFSATVNGSKGRFKLSPLSFNLAGGKVTEKASLDVAAFPARWKESVHIAGVQAGPLLSTFSGVDYLEGTMAMDTSLRATGLTEAAIGKLNGHGNFSFRDGKLKHSMIGGILQGICNFSDIRKLLFSGKINEIMNFTAKDLDFSQLRGKFDVVNGRIDNQVLYLASPFVRISGNGKVFLTSKQIDYQVTPMIIGSCRGQGDANNRKGFKLPIHFIGTYDSPKVDRGQLIKDLPKALMPFIGHGGGTKGALGALGKIMGGGGATAGQGGAQPQGQPASPQKKLLDGLGGMIPGF